jgi:hypothetical protein
MTLTIRPLEKMTLFAKSGINTSYNIGAGQNAPHF